MTFALIAASHTPLMGDSGCPPEVQSDIDRAFRELAETLHAFQPDLIVQFSPDHFNAFGPDLMPTFCLGYSAEALGDWGTSKGPLVAAEEASALAEALMAHGFDLATSRHMRVDHGFIQIWDRMLGGVPSLPLIPIFINCASEPRPTTKRARELGNAVGQFSRTRGKRILFAASGGLSHDPPAPKAAIIGIERSVDDIQFSEQLQRDRQARVRAAAQSVLDGKPEILPVSEQWDTAFLDALRHGPAHTFDNLSIGEIVREAGRGGPEVLCWIAAMAALRATGCAETRLHAYHPVQGWIAGMAMLSGHS